MAQPGLRRLDVLVLKNRSGSDVGQVPAAATVDLYQQGASVRTAVTIYPHSADNVIEVYESGRLQAGSIFSIGPGGAQFTIDSIVLASGGNPTQIWFSNPTSGGPYAVAVGTRLLFVGGIGLARPTLYAGPLGQAGDIIAGHSFTTDSATGQGAIYVKETRFDYVVSGTGLTSRVFPDAEGNYVGSPLGWLNVLDFPTIQATVDAIPAGGGVVYIPPGTYDPTTTPAYNPPLILPYDRPIQLFGDGPRISQLAYKSGGTYSVDPSLNLVEIRGDFQHVHGLSLIGQGVAGSGIGIRIWRAQDSASTNLIYRAHVSDCEITGTASWGLRVDDQLRNGVQMFAVWGIYDNLEISGVQSGGCIYIGGVGTTTQYVRSSRLHGFNGYGIYGSHNAAWSVLDTEFVDNDNTPMVYVDSCESVVISQCSFTGFHPAGLEYVRAIGTYRGLTIEACSFNQEGTVTVGGTRNNITAIRLSAWGRGVVVLNPTIALLGGDASSGSGGHIVIEAPTQSDQPTEVVIIGGSFTDVSTTTSSDPIHHIPDIIDNSSRTVLVNAGWRIRLPRLSGAEIAALPAPRIGDMVFNSDTNKAQIHSSSGWVPLW